MKQKTISINSKVPDCIEINYLGTKGWDLEFIREYYNDNGSFDRTEYVYFKIPLRKRILNLFLQDD